MRHWILAGLLGLIAAGRGEAAFAPVVVTESIDNQGGVLTFNGAPFTDLIRNIAPGQSNPPVEDRAVVVFDLRNMSIGTTGATLSFTFSGNNYGGDSIRTFTESTFASSGTASLTDFAAPASQVGTQTFDIFTSPQTFSLHLTNVQLSLAGQFLGVRFGATDPNSFPSVVYGASLNFDATSVPEPSSLTMMGIAGIAGWGGVRVRSRRLAT